MIANWNWCLRSKVMNVFLYDKTFDGLLTVVFDAYFRKTFPDLLLKEGEPLPLFYTEAVTSVTDEAKSNRVWKSLQKKLSSTALSMMTACWLSELPEVDMLLFRYMCKNIDSPGGVELSFGDPDVLEVAKLSKKVSQERHRVMQFMRFQKASDGTFFGAMEPLYNVLPLALDYLKNRFGYQKWLVYDIRRKYGFYYDLTTVTEVYFEGKESHLLSGFLKDELMAEDEQLFQQLWKQYFQAISIKERRNPKLHRQNMPVRFWKYLTEKRR